MAGLLGRMGSSGWSSVLFREENVIGVSVSPPRHGASGRPQVLTCSAQSSKDVNGQTLMALARKLSSSSKQWIFTLDRHDYKILVIPEPHVLQTEVEQSLRWAIANQIDYPVEEANIAWMKIPTIEHLPNRPTHLYAMVARRDLVADVEQSFKSAGLALKAVDVHETAQRNIANLVAKPGEGIGLLRLGNEGFQFTISMDGELYLDRFVEESLFDETGQDAESEQRALERIALQVQRSLAFIDRNMPFITVGRVLIAPLPRQMALKEFMAQYLTVPVEPLSLADCFDCTLVPELLQEDKQAFYFTALGAALRFADKSGRVEQ